MTRTDTLLLSLDAACILWVIVVVMNPFDYLIGVLSAMLKVLGVVLAFLPPFVGVLLAANGADEILGKVMAMYLAEIVGCIFLIVSMGVFGLIKSVAAVYQLMISLPCWFVLGTIAYWSW